MRNGKKVIAVITAVLMGFSVTANHFIFVNADTSANTEYTAYSEKDSTSEGVTDWGIYTAADWLAAVADSKSVSSAFAGQTLHIMNDINMENTAMDPLAYGGTFTGTLDGHGYVFKNININETITGATPVGLVGEIAAGGIIQNVGIESGNITVTYNNSSSDAYGIGAIVGNGPGSNNTATQLAYVINCWNGADVSVTTVSGKSPSVSGLVGRGAVVIDGCYNTGSIYSTGSHASALNDWGQKYTYVYNSFSSGTVTAAGSTTNRMIFRYSSGCGIYANLYAVGTIAKFTTDDATTNYVLSDSAYSSGELAYLLNQGYTEYTDAVTYYTVENGKTVFGTEENQVVKVEITTLTSTGQSSTSSYYVPAGSKYSLGDGIESYEVTVGSVTIEDGQFTVPATDVAITVTLAGLSTDSLEEALALYDGKDTAYFAYADALAALIDDVNEKLAHLVSGSGDTYTAQTDIDADEALLRGYYVYADAPNLPSVSEMDTYTDAPGYVITTVEELEYVGSNPTKYASGKTIYLDADLDLKDSSFNGIYKLYSDFDGMGHIVSNYTGTSSFFRDYFGSSIANLTMTDSEITGGYAIAAIVDRYASKLTISNVTVENTSVYKAANDANNGAAIIVGQYYSADVPVTVQYCVVRDCTIDVTGTSRSEIVNIGMIMGQSNKTGSVFDHNLSINNKIITPTMTNAAGLYIGEVNTTGATTITNSAVWGGSLETVGGGYYSTGAEFIGSYKDNTTAQAAVLTIDNVVVCGVENAENTNNVIDIYQKYGILNVSNLYYDCENLIYRSNTTSALNGTDIIDKDTIVEKETEAFLSGEAIYELNSVNGESAADWALVQEDTTVFSDTYMKICFADEDNAAPVKVTFTAADNSDNNTGFEKIYYTDGTGIMIGSDIGATISAADWGDDTLTAAKKFTEDTGYDVVLNDIGAEICYVSLSLAGNIGINFYVKLSDSVINNASAYMQFTVEDEIQTVKVADVLNSVTQIDGENYYVFTCNVNAIQMTVPVTAQLIVDDTNRSLAAEYSVQEYAEAVLSDDGMSDATKEVVKALVNYGGYAQIRFNSEYVYANEILDESDRELEDFTIDADAYVSGSSGELEGIQYYGSTLALDSCTAIRMYFILDDGSSIDDYTFTVAGTELVPVSNKGMYYVDVENINAYGLGNMYTVTVTKSESAGADSITINYSVMSYVKNMCGRDTTAEKEKNILKALYWLYIKAVDFYNE